MIVQFKTISEKGFKSELTNIENTIRHFIAIPRKIVQNRRKNFDARVQSENITIKILDNNRFLIFYIA